MWTNSNHDCLIDSEVKLVGRNFSARARGEAVLNCTNSDAFWMAAVQIWHMNGLTWNTSNRQSHPLRTNAESSCCLYLFLFTNLQLHTAAVFPSLLPFLPVFLTQRHIMGGSFIFDHDSCPICPLAHTHRRWWSRVGQLETVVFIVERMYRAVRSNHWLPLFPLGVSASLILTGPC